MTQRKRQAIRCLIVLNTWHLNFVFPRQRSYWCGWFKSVHNFYFHWYLWIQCNEKLKQLQEIKIFICIMKYLQHKPKFLAFPLTNLKSELPGKHSHHSLWTHNHVDSTACVIKRLATQGVKNNKNLFTTKKTCFNFPHPKLIKGYNLLRRNMNPWQDLNALHRNRRLLKIFCSLCHFKTLPQTTVHNILNATEF